VGVIPAALGILLLAIGGTLLHGPARRGLVGASIPLALLSPALAWLRSVPAMREGFEAGGRSGETGVVFAALEAVRTSTLVGTLAGFMFLLLITATGAWLLRDHDVGEASTWRSSVLLAAAGVSAIGALAAGALGIRVLPLPVTLVTGSEPGSLGAAALTIAEGMKNLALVSLTAVVLCGAGGILAWAMTLSGKLRRWALSLSVALAAAASIGTAVQARQISAMEDELALAKARLDSAIETLPATEEPFAPAPPPP
jgi:hypothetical protein